MLQNSNNVLSMDLGSQALHDVLSNHTLCNVALATQNWARPSLLNSGTVFKQLVTWFNIGKFLNFNV